MPPRRTAAPKVEPLEIEEPDLDDASEDDPLDVTEGEVLAEIEGVRTSPNAWWCPEDDTSMPLSMPTCPKCGFIR